MTYSWTSFSTEALNSTVSVLIAESWLQGEPKSKRYESTAPFGNRTLTESSPPQAGETARLEATRT